MRVQEIDGKPVFDAKKPLILTVNRNDVAKADAKEPADCAVARACRRELHAKEVRVHLGRVYVRLNEGNWTRYITPKAMRSEIIAFDRGGAFEPGEFRLAAPEPSKALGKRRGGSKPFKRSGKKRTAPHVVTNVRVGPA
jgi:hypothetical protein